MLLIVLFSVIVKWLVATAVYSNAASNGAQAQVPRFLAFEHADPKRYRGWWLLDNGLMCWLIGTGN